jgi:hypothetical protein
VGLARVAVAGSEAVRALQRHELVAGHEPALLAMAQLARVVVPAGGGSAAPGLERVHVPVQPGGAVLALVGAHHVARRVGESGAEQLHHRVPPGQPHGRLPEVDLRLGAGVVGQRQGHCPRGRRPVPAHPLPDGRLAAGEVVLSDQPLPDPLRRVPLLARPLQVLLQPALHHLGHRPHHRLRRRALPSVVPRTGVGQGPADRPAAMVEGVGQLPDADALTEVGPSDTFDLRHLGHVVAPARGVTCQSPRCWQFAGQGGGPPLRHRSGPGWVPFSLAFVGPRRPPTTAATST